MDNGSQFGAHRRGDNKDSRFKRHVESRGIKRIPTSIKLSIHRPTSGKIEKFFDCYNRYRVR